MDDTQVRAAAFAFLDNRLRERDWFTLTELQQGFVLHGERISLTGLRGVHVPSQMDLPLSLRTNLSSVYRDETRSDGLLLYDYAPARFERSNEGLRQVMLEGLPLIYLLDTGSKSYLPTYPVFIVEDNPAERQFLVSATARSSAMKHPEYQVVEPGYAYSLQARRLHQRHFRIVVLAAYGNSCSMCSLKHAPLLDAAHIRPDKMERAVQASRGLSLCKIHHAAFDLDYLGVEPIGQHLIRVRRDILEESDGPMLRHGLQALDGQPLALPTRPSDRPDPTALEERWERFEKVG